MNGTYKVGFAKFRTISGTLLNGNKKTFALSVSALVIGILMSANCATAKVIRVYWTDRDNATLSATNVPSNSTTLLASGYSRLQDVDLDTSTDTLYFADWGPVGPPGNEGSINKINKDGTGVGTVIGAGAIGDAVHQLALDEANQRIYFTRAVSYDDREISRVDVSGANYTTIRTGTGGGTDGWFYSGLAVDFVNNLIYWGDIGVITPAPPADGAVNSITLTGGSPTTLIPHVDGKGRGYALDQASQTIFYTSHNAVGIPGAGGGLFAYDIGSGTETQLINDPDTGYWDVEIDPIDQRVWWTDFARGQVRSAKFDGSDVQIELTNLTNPYGLALEVVPEPSCLVLTVLGLAGMACRLRRNRFGNKRTVHSRRE